MKSSFAKAMRRATRQTRGGKPGSATLTMQRAVRAAMLKTTAASMSHLSAMMPAAPKAARKPRKRAPAVAPKTDRRLSTVLGQLRAARAAMVRPFLPSGNREPSSPPVIPQGAHYLQRRHAGAAGARDFKLYLPAGRPDGPRGLIVMLHGCTQDPDDFATGTNMNVIAQKHGMAVAYPAQTGGHNAASCWNWFAPANQRRGAGEPAIIAALARVLMREYGLDRTRVFVAGLSAGGAMAAILADTYPDVFSAAGMHSGLARGSADTVMKALSVMRDGAQPGAVPPGRRVPATKDSNVRRIVFQGDADTTVHPSNAQQIVAAAVGTRMPAKSIRKSASGRDYVRNDYALPDGRVDLELWQINGAAHAWSGGKKGGSFTDTKGPDASAEMMRFFLTDQT